MTPIDEHLWTATHDFTQPGGVVVPGRMNVIRLPDGALVVHSPLPGNEERASFIDRLGPVRWIVSPSCLHHLGLAAAHERWPAAEVLGPPGLDPKTKVPVRPWNGPPAAWGDTIADHLVAGAPALGELALLHRPTGTLFVADLLFNLIGPMNVVTAALTTVLGTRGRLARSRLWGLYGRDTAAVRASVAAIGAWPIRRLVPCHGAIVEDPEGSATRSALATF